MFELKHINNWSYYSLPELELKGVLHGFFTKTSPSHLMEGEDRKGFLNTFGLSDLIIMDQEHGNEVHVIKNLERPQKGDGLVLVEKNTAGIIKTADCLPIIIADRDIPLAAIVHAGWRGTVRKITEKALEKMAGLGAKPQRMTVLFGPSIRACCYEVGEDVKQAFREEGFSNEIYKEEGSALFLDLVQANRELVEAAGVRDVHDVGLCTLCNREAFASFRRGDHSLRQISFVSVLDRV
ncbi:MAG TPA: peptidoglycan editing factor PgeF [Syntrophorhabdaceae bacterium]|nr:peptidoglycan editing factor PgeF [Syntrophorhabdaceae bacterium]